MSKSKFHFLFFSHLGLDAKNWRGQRVIDLSFLDGENFEQKWGSLITSETLEQMQEKVTICNWIWGPRRTLLNTKSHPTLGHISACSVVIISVLEKWTLFYGLNKVRPKLEPWGVNDFFIHRNSAKFSATTNLLNFLCCTGTSIGSQTKYILNSAKKRWSRDYIKTAHGV